MLYQVKDLMPEFVLKKMYFAHVQSLLLYCNLIWSNTNKTDLTPIILTQKRILRIITKSEFLAHTRPLFKSTRILNVENLRKLSLAVYCYRNKNNLNHLMAQHDYFTRHRNQLRPAIHRTSHFEKSFIYQAPIIWNDIVSNQHHIAESPLINIFKRRYKSHLIANI